MPEIPFDKHHAEAQADELQEWSTMLDELLAELSASPQNDVLPAGRAGGSSPSSSARRP